MSYGLAWFDEEEEKEWEDDEEEEDLTFFMFIFHLIYLFLERVLVRG